jgi:membrane-bound inhibitor of C-type lysozyme
LPSKIGDGNFCLMKAKRETRVSMREGDRILINKGISKKVFIVARVDSKSGGKYTIGLKVWKSDYVWSEKNQMWVPKH